MMKHNRLFQRTEMSSQMSFSLEEMSMIPSGEHFELDSGHRTRKMGKVEEEKIKGLLCLIFFFNQCLQDSSLITEENKIT